MKESMCVRKGFHKHKIKKMDSVFVEEKEKEKIKPHQDRVDRDL